MRTHLAQLTPWLAGLGIVAGGGMLACSDDARVAPGSGGAGASNASSSTVSATTSQSVVTAATTSTASGMSNFACNPAAEPGSIFALEDDEVFPPFEPRSMCEFRGDVMLIFNAAAL